MLDVKECSNSEIQEYPVSLRGVGLRLVESTTQRALRAGGQMPVEDPGHFTGNPGSANAGKGFRRNYLD